VALIDRTRDRPLDGNARVQVLDNDLGFKAIHPNGGKANSGEAAAAAEGGQNAAANGGRSGASAFPFASGGSYAAAVAPSSPLASARAAAAGVNAVGSFLSYGMTAAKRFKAQVPVFLATFLPWRLVSCSSRGAAFRPRPPTPTKCARSSSSSRVAAPIRCRRPSPTAST